MPPWAWCLPAGTLWAALWVDRFGWYATGRTGVDVYWVPPGHVLHLPPLDTLNGFR